MADVAAFMIIHIVLKPISLVRAAKEDAGVRTVIAQHFKLQIEVAELLVTQQQAAVAGAGRVLFAHQDAVFHPPMAAGAVPNLLRRFVPALERLAVEQRLGLRASPGGRGKRKARQAASSEKGASG